VRYPNKIEPTAEYWIRIIPRRTCTLVYICYIIYYILFGRMRRYCTTTYILHHTDCVWKIWILLLSENAFFSVVLKKTFSKLFTVIYKINNYYRASETKTHYTYIIIYIKVVLCITLNLNYEERMMINEHYINIYFVW